MGNCTCGNSSGFDTGSFSEGDPRAVEELVKAHSLEEANRLIAEGCVFLTAYWNMTRASEEYVLGKVAKKHAPSRKMGFSIP